MSWFTEICCKSAEKFIRELDETRAGLWHKDAMVYRGHADSSWCLRPTLYRKSYGGTAFEINVVTGSVLASQRNGLVIPPDAMSYASQFDQENNRNPAEMRLPLRGKYAVDFDVTNIVFAMARHAEIPTRHLDFTWDPLVATYFAAQGVLEDYVHAEKTPPSHLAVWAINYNNLRHVFGVMEHDWSNIPSLRNQKGLFIYDPTLQMDELTCWTQAPSFDAVLAAVGDADMTTKITLECSDANIKELREYLRRRGIVKSFILPTYENVRDFVMAHYEKPSPAEME